MSFGLENLGTAPAEIVPRALAALAVVGAEHLAERARSPSSPAASCSASASRRRSRSSRELLLLDEPSSQLDRDAAEALFEHARAQGCAVVVAEQRPELPLAFADRVVFLRDGRVVDDLPRAWTDTPSQVTKCHKGNEEVVRLERVSFAYQGGPPVLVDESL